MDKKEALTIIKNFVGGKLPITEFKNICLSNSEFRSLIKGFQNCNIGKKYNNEILNMVDNYNWKNYKQQYIIQLVFANFLINKDITNFKRTSIYREKACEYADLIPDWLSDDAMTYVDEEIIEKAPETLSEKEKKKWIKKRVKETFKYEKRPPEFAQEGMWPQDDEGNFLVFRKQKEKGDLVTYIFVDPKTKKEVKYEEFY